LRIGISGSTLFHNSSDTVHDLIWAMLSRIFADSQPLQTG
jgi:hypothetical protein